MLQPMHVSYHRNVRWMHCISFWIRHLQQNHFLSEAAFFFNFLTTPWFMAVPPMFIEGLKMSKEIDRNIHDLHMHPALNMSIHINSNVHIRHTIYDQFPYFNLKSCRTSFTCRTAYPNECQIAESKVKFWVYCPSVEWEVGWPVR